MERNLPQVDRLAADPAHTLAKMHNFDRLVGEVRQSLPPVRQAKTSSLLAAAQASLADLVRSGTISVQQRTASRTRSDTATVGHTALTSADILAGGPATGTATCAAGDDPAPRVRADDILIPVMGREIVAQVATSEQVGAELGPGVQLVRVGPARFDPWFVAGILSNTDNLRVAGRASSASSGTLRIDVKRLTLPVLPLDQQKA